MEQFACRYAHFSIRFSQQAVALNKNKKMIIIKCKDFYIVRKTYLLHLLSSFLIMEGCVLQSFQTEDSTVCRMLHTTLPSFMWTPSLISTSADVCTWFAVLWQFLYFLVSPCTFLKRLPYVTDTKFYNFIRVRVYRTDIDLFISRFLK